MPKDGAEDEYIQMKTIKDVLMKHPFSLDSDEATLVSKIEPTVVDSSPSTKKRKKCSSVSGLKTEQTIKNEPAGT